MLIYSEKELICSLDLLSHGVTMQWDIMKTRSLATIYRVLLLHVLPKRTEMMQEDIVNEMRPFSTSK